MRAANEIDFWRGFALVSIFINHIPGFAFERFTHRNFGLSDSAELFVFLAGWSLRRLADGGTTRIGLVRLILRLGARCVTLYAAQILITMLAIGMIAACAILFQNPLLLNWHNAAAVFEDPVEAHLGLILLTHQLGFFDILPLYVVLMSGAPFLAVLHRFVPRLVLPVSLLIYTTTLAFDLNLPTWPVEGTWYFDPFAWQLIFVLGFSLAGETFVGGFARRNLRHLRWLGLFGVVVGLALALLSYSPDPMRVPSPPLFFVFDKTHLSPARVVHFLAVLVVFAGGFSPLMRLVPWLVRFLSMLGRNSLNVFCIGSLLSLAGQLARFRLGGSLPVDAGVLVIGLAGLGLVAWVSELRERLRRNAPEPLPRLS